MTQMKVTTARRTASRYVIRVHLDTTRMLAAGGSDPAWCREWEWALLTQGPDESGEEFQKRRDAYEQMMLERVRLLAARELTRATESAGVALVGEGVTFTAPALVS